MTKRGPYTREKNSAWAKAGRGQHPLEEATQKISPHRCYTTAVNSAYTEAHEASGRLVVANNNTDVGKGQRKEGKAGRTAKFNLEASPPQNYNLGGRTHAWTNFKFNLQYTTNLIR